MKELLQQALDTPGCERLRDFAAVGPAQRAALELFVDRIRAAEGEPVAWAISYDGVRPYSLWDSGDGPLLDLEVKRLGGTAKKMPLYTAPLKAAPEATQYIALCDAMGYNERTDSLTSPEEHAQSLMAEIKRLKDQVQEAVAAEREACAKVLDDWKKHNWTFEDCAAVVRARGEK